MLKLEFPIKDQKRRRERNEKEEMKRNKWKGRNEKKERKRKRRILDRISEESKKEKIGGKQNNSRSIKETRKENRRSSDQINFRRDKWPPAKGKPIFKVVWYENFGLIISKSKMEICKTHISFLGTEIGNGKIRLQPHISQKILGFPDKMEDTKTLRAFLGLLNYARNFINDLGKYTVPLYNKTSLTGQRKFNTEDIKLVQKIKEMVNNLPYLS